MFTHARLRLTALYASLMLVTLALAAGAMVLLASREMRRTDDLELRLRAEGQATDVLQGVAVSAPQESDSRHGGRGNEFVESERHERLEQQGTLVYVLPVAGGQVASLPSSAVRGLPNQGAAAEALAAGTGRFHTEGLPQGEVRLYSLPVARDGGVVAVVQVARSRYFVDQALTRLLLVVAGVGASGLLLSTAAGFWLAGRTLRPIAAALRRQRDFAADASHELRTPLTLLRGNAELLLRHPDRPIRAYHDAVQDIVDESDRLGRLVSDLLTLARADQGRLHLARAAVDLSAAGAALAREFAPLAAARGLTLRAEVGPGVTVWGDRDRLHQLGVILLDNAIRYTAAGEVVLRVGKDAHGVVIGVTDTGPGIAAEHLPHVFERFYRTDAARSGEHGGTGLGLAIARWIAEAHGGRIDAASAPGRGSTFTVRLPA